MWDQSFWQSRDKTIPDPPCDDDHDGKEDKIKMTFQVAACTMKGEHLHNDVVDVTKNFDCVDGGDPNIPGDPDSNLSGPKEILNTLKSGGKLDPGGVAGGDICPAELDQTGDADAPDCNRDGVPDVVEIAFGDAEDEDGDGVPDNCTCPADFDGDGSVNGGDLGTLLRLWTVDPNSETGPADLDGDGAVGGDDLALLLAAWGPC